MVHYYIIDSLCVLFCRRVY